MGNKLTCTSDDTGTGSAPPGVPRTQTLGGVLSPEKVSPPPQPPPPS
jgi:hypothetical protein